MDQSKPTRVLHVCKVYTPVVGGVQRVVEQLIKHTPFFEHHVLTTGEDGAIPEEILDTSRITRCRSYGEVASLPLAPSLPKRMFSLFRDNDLIAIHYPFPLADLGVLISWWRRPIIVHWHSNVVAQRKLKLLVAPLTFLMLLRSRKIVVTSDLMLKHSAWLSLFKYKTISIPYCIQASPTTNNEFAQPNSDYFCLIGRHVSYKGFDIAIKALQHNTCKIKIVGNGPLFHKHKNLARDLGVGDRVEFIQHANDELTSKILEQSIAFILSSKSHNEAFALVQLEAMSKAKAIINTSLPSSVPWVARDQQEAITIPANDHAALAQAMEMLQNSTELTAKLGSAGLERYQTTFSDKKFSDSIVDLYQDAVTSE